MPSVRYAMRYVIWLISSSVFVRRVTLHVVHALTLQLARSTCSSCFSAGSLLACMSLSSALFRTATPRMKATQTAFVCLNATATTPNRAPK